MARKKVGLGQKSVARMLGYKSTSPISEYETGRLIPSLRTAFKLAVLYNLSLQELYAPLYGEVQQEIEGRRQGSVLVHRAATKGASLL
jgi:transcriptional regulator with XRE-family HTH domain